MESNAAPLDERKLMAFVGKVVGDFGAAFSGSLALLGEELGLFDAMKGAGGLTSAELASRTGLDERHVREWLLHFTAAGYVEHDATTGRYVLPREHAEVLTKGGPFDMTGGFMVVDALQRARERIRESFRTGKGMTWGEHHPSLFEGTARFFRPAYERHLVGEWVPSIPGLAAKLDRGARVADIGCGFGLSTALMAKAWPRSTFVGFDDHAGSIATATATASSQGLSNATFSTRRAQELPGDRFDLACFFDCLHDMGDPAGALAAVRAVLADDGAVMVIEPWAGRTVDENASSPVGRLFSGASVLCCTPNARATGPVALGTLASEDALRGVASEAGFGQFRQTWSDPFTRVFAATR